MRRKELLGLFQTEYETNPKTGRPRKVARYIGGYYEADRPALRKARPQLLALWLTVSAAFLTAGLTVAKAQYCVYVLPFYALTLLGLFNGATALFRAWRLTPQFDALQNEECFKTGKNAAWTVLLAGALWAVGDIVFLLLGNGGDRVGETTFLVCGGVTAACGFLQTRLWRSVTVRKLPETGEESGKASPGSPENP